jgi:hypothetical protein
MTMESSASKSAAPAPTRNRSAANALPPPHPATTDQINQPTNPNEGAEKPQRRVMRCFMDILKSHSTPKKCARIVWI